MKLNEFKQNLERYFINNDKEWIDVNVVNVNRIDITVVSNKVDNLIDSKHFIQTQLENLNDLINNHQMKYYIGHTNYYTPDEADFFDITKPERRVDEPKNFAELIDLNRNDLEYINKEIERSFHKSKIVSFYSYKGGVGRTLALIQTAYLLAKEGKKVLLMDLDIEAPSFFNIFRDHITKDTGIVDYLYDQLYSNTPTLKLSNIISKLNVSTSGEIFIIPSGNIGYEYVKKLDYLKEKRIFENKYVHKLIKKAEEDFNIDYVLVDSRTGINKWGALALIDIAHEVMLFGYPNRENIEGLKLIIDLVHDQKKVTVVLSRIHSNNKGKEMATKLFNELGLEQEFIPIYYHEHIALANEYPIKQEDLNTSYKVISDFILENEINRLNEKYIKDNEKNIKHILSSFIELEETIGISDHEFKAHNSSNCIIIGCESVLNKRIKLVLETDYQYIDKENLGEDLDSAITKMIITNNSLKNKLNNARDVLTAIASSGENSIMKFWIAYIFFIINDNITNKKYKNRKIRGNNELKNKSFSQYLDYDIGPSTFENALVSYYTDKENNSYKYMQEVNLIIYWTKISEFLHGYPNQNEIKSEFLNTIIKINQSVEPMNIKVFVNTSDYTSDKSIFENFDSNSLNLNWSSLDNHEDKISKTFEHLSNIISTNSLLKKPFNNELMDYLNYMEGKANRTAKFKEENNNSGAFKIMFSISRDYRQKLINFIIGKRIDKNIYSKEIIDWVSENLESVNRFNPIDIIRLIKFSAKIELDNYENKKENDRIISLESLKSAFKLLND